MPARLRAVTVAVVALGLAGCGDDTGPIALPTGPAGSSAGSTAPAGTPGPTPAADPVLAAYLRYWDVVVAANRRADPRYAGLTTVAVEPQLGRVRGTVNRNRIQQLSLRGRVTHRPGAAAVAGTTATIEDCYDISGWNPVNLRTGERVDVTEQGGTGRYRARYTLRQTGGSWLVADQTALGGC